jgi:hypothetical protein
VNSHRVAAAATAAIAIVLFALTFGFEEMPEGITRGFGAEIFPRLVLGAIVALSVLLFITSPGAPALERIPAMVYYSGAALLVFMVVVPLGGMLPAMFLFLLGLGWLWGERRYWRLGVTAVLFTAAIWAVFVRGFGVQMPKGLLG